VQLVEYLLLLELQLFFIGQVLPFATTAYTEVLAKRYGAHLAVFYKAHHLALGKRVLFASYLDITNIPWHAEWYEDHQVVPVEQTFSFGSNGLNGNAF
jgi:hypothetical protein